jgi:hypothetical protein
MGLRFRRSVRLLPGVRWNFGLKSTSISIGRPGLRYTFGTKGARISAGVPGTGVSWTQSAPTPAQMVSRVPITSNIRRIWLPAIVFVAAIVLAYVSSQSNKSADRTPTLSQPVAQTAAPKSIRSPNDLYISETLKYQSLTGERASPSRGAPSNQ